MGGCCCTLLQHHIILFLIVLRARCLFRFFVFSFVDVIIIIVVAIKTTTTYSSCAHRNDCIFHENPSEELKTLSRLCSRGQVWKYVSEKSNRIFIILCANYNIALRISVLIIPHFRVRDLPSLLVYKAQRITKSIFCLLFHSSRVDLFSLLVLCRPCFSSASRVFYITSEHYFLG